MLAIVAGGGLVAGAALFGSRPQPPAAAATTVEVPSPAETVCPLNFPRPAETAPVPQASPPEPTVRHTAGVMRPPSREAKVASEMAKVRRLLEQHANMKDLAEMRAVENELRAARERIAKLPK